MIWQNSDLHRLDVEHVQEVVDEFLKKFTFQISSLKSLYRDRLFVTRYDHHAAVFPDDSDWSPARVESGLGGRSACQHGRIPVWPVAVNLKFYQ